MPKHSPHCRRLESVCDHDMRVQYYISSLLIIAILGTVAVGGTVGVMLGKEQLRVLSSGQASDMYKRVQSLRTNSDELLAVMDILTTESSGVFVIVDRLVIRCRADLEHIAKEFPPETILPGWRKIL